MAIVACICTKEIKDRALREFAATKIIVSKSGRGSRSECCSGSHYCASISCFLNFVANPGQTRIIFKLVDDPDKWLTCCPVMEGIALVKTQTV